MPASGTSGRLGGSDMRTLNLLALAAGLLASPAFASHHGSVQDCWEPAFTAGDAEAVAACYAEDAVLWLPGAPAMQGRDEIRAGYADFFDKFQIESMVLEEAGRTELGDDAASWGRFTLTMVSREDGQQIVEVGRYTDVSRKVDGEWVYVVDHASDDPPPPAE